MSELAPDQSTVATARIRGNLLRWIPLAVVVAGLDQATKAWVTSARNRINDALSPPGSGARICGQLSGL